MDGYFDFLDVNSFSNLPTNFTITCLITTFEPAPSHQGAQPARRKYTYAAASPGSCKVKWTAEEKPHGGTGLSSGRRSSPPPNDVSFDHKWKWEPKSKPGAAGKAKTKLEEANEDDKNKPARKCMQIEEVLAGCDAIGKWKVPLGVLTDKLLYVLSKRSNRHPRATARTRSSWIRSKRPGIAIPCQHPSPIPTTDAGGDCHGRSAVSPATRGDTTTRVERCRASRWRPEKAAPEDSGEGVPARLGTGKDAHDRSTAPPAARGSPVPLVLGVGVTGEVGARYDAVGSAIREPERRWAPCVSAGAGSPLRQMPVARAPDHAAEGGLPPLDADEAPCRWGPRVRPPPFFATRLSLIEETKDSWPQRAAETSVLRAAAVAGTTTPTNTRASDAVGGIVAQMESLRRERADNVLKGKTREQSREPRHRCKSE
ncbi:uncharacterized protein LOC119271948 [Triticum dicoccoides]|nr:uncharacterized protein LOC119271948 [Triticum dicoccoides]